MSISFKKYVNIISGVGGGGGVRQRDLIGRIFTINPLVSPDSIMEFTDAASVGLMFGTTSPEYLRAVKYFGYISPTISTAKTLSFARYAPAAIAPAVYSNDSVKVLATLKTIVAGLLTLTINGVATPITAISFAAATTLADVATALQAKLVAAGGVLIGAVVTYDVTTRRFLIQLAGGNIGTIDTTIAGTGVTDVGTLMGLYTALGGIDITGIAAQQPVDALIRSINISNNFGSFVFRSGAAVTQDQSVALASYNATLNLQFMYCVATPPLTAATLSAALTGNAGTALTLVSAVSDTLDEMMPMIILAATDYNKRNSVQSYMFRQFDSSVAQVSDDATSTTYDNLRVNYYGQTATAGQKISFYQRGVLMGGATAPVDMNTYANEMWLKDYAGSQIMGLLLAGRVPANISGTAMIRNVLRPVIDAGLFNGAISVGKTLTAAQKVFIESQTGDPLAWVAVQNIGYVLLVDIEPPIVTVDGRTEYKATYTLIYSKDDAIRAVDGTHSLI